MNIDILTDLQNILEKYIKDNSNIPCDVKTYSTSEVTTNRIILQEPINTEVFSTLNKEETVSNLVYQIDIYSPLDYYIENKDDVETQIILSKVEQARSLSKLVNDIFQKKLKFRRIMCSPTPNIDNNVYRITMQYTGKLLDNLKLFLK